MTGQGMGSKIYLLPVIALMSAGVVAADVKVDFGRVVGPVHAVHGVGQGPLLPLIGPVCTMFAQAEMV